MLFSILISGNLNLSELITEHNLNTTTFKIGVEKGRYQANVGCNTISGAFEFTVNNKIIFLDSLYM